VVKGKGRTRDWLIIALLPARKREARQEKKNTNEKRLAKTSTNIKRCFRKGSKGRKAKLRRVSYKYAKK